jgi:hypothetical protein
MSRNVSILSVVGAMAVLSVLFGVTMAFAEQGGGRWPRPREGHPLP